MMYLMMMNITCTGLGRTGRAGKTGIAFTFVSGKEVYQLRDIMRYTKTKSNNNIYHPPAMFKKSKQATSSRESKE